MQQKNLLLKSLFIASIFTLMPHPVQASNNLVPLAIGIACGTATYAGLKIAYLPMHSELTSYSRQAKTALKKLAPKRDQFDRNDLDPKEVDELINKVGIPCLSVLAGVVAFMMAASVELAVTAITH